LKKYLVDRVEAERNHFPSTGIQYGYDEIVDKKDE